MNYGIYEKEVMRYQGQNQIVKYISNKNSPRREQKDCGVGGMMENQYFKT